MKNDRYHQSRQGRAQRMHKSNVPQDIIEDIQVSIGLEPKRPSRRRRVNYERKIMNDPLIFNA